MHSDGGGGQGSGRVGRVLSGPRRRVAAVEIPGPRHRSGTRDDSGDPWEYASRHVSSSRVCVCVCMVYVFGVRSGFTVLSLPGSIRQLPPRVRCP